MRVVTVSLAFQGSTLPSRDRTPIRRVREGAPRVLDIRPPCPRRGNRIPAASAQARRVRGRPRRLRGVTPPGLASGVGDRGGGSDLVGWLFLRLLGLVSLLAFA